MAGYSPDMDEIWTLVAQEGRETLEMAEDSLLKLENDPQNPSEIASLFRSLHTFKGTVRMMNFSVAEKFAHHAEDLVALIRDEGVLLDGVITGLLLNAIDEMRSVLNFIIDHHEDISESSVAAISKRLSDMITERKSNLSAQKEISPTAGPAQSSKKSLHAVKSSPKKRKKTNELPETEEPIMEALIFEPVNLADNPVYVQMFLETTDQEIAKIEHILKPEGSLSNVKVNFNQLDMVNSSIDSLMIACEQMGYTHLVGILNEILALTHSSQKSFTPENLDSLKKFFEDFKSRICELKDSGIEKEEQSLPTWDGTNLLLTWYSARMQKDTGCLIDDIQKLDGYQQEVINEQND
ncbi:MAG: Hpt domain-containing protein, partial [Anaerolineae bacterium]|nr:Hpt domain-containing protein [Anaerolineae bacterium]